MKKTLFLIITITVLFFLNLLLGSVHIDFNNVLAVLMGDSKDQIITFIVMQSRLPQALTALLVGASLSLAGLLLQTAFHNPLAGPSVLGISGGASLGVAIVTLGASFIDLPFLGSPFSIITAALIGSMLVTMLLLFLNSLLRNNLVLLITGLLIGYLISSLSTILNVFASPESLRGYVLWGMGDFSSVSLDRLPALASPLIILILLGILMIKPLNAIMLGDQYAANLGINIKATHNILLFIVGGITALTTAYCGPIAFIGLSVPHIARMIVRTDNFMSLMPMTIFTGAAAALVCNLASTIPDNTVLPINAVTPLIGVPVILYVVIQSRKF